MMNGTVCIARVIGFTNDLVKVEYYHYNKYKFETFKKSDLSNSNS